MSYDNTNIITTPIEATSTNDNTFDGFSNCLICHQTFNLTSRAPLVIPCGDTVCRECIQSSIQAGAFKCVDCNDIVAINDLKELPVNVSLIRSLETMKVIATDNVIMPAKSRPKVDVFDLEKQLDDYLAEELMQFTECVDDEVDALDEAIYLIKKVYKSIEAYATEMNRRTTFDEDDVGLLQVPGLTAYDYNYDYGYYNDFVTTGSVADSDQLEADEIDAFEANNNDTRIASRSRACSETSVEMEDEFGFDYIHHSKCK
uniref:RING-type domain-containing protein n=1 Tax=Panagrellus redivivus TaxID=6233 RepID=A0A7E4UNX4_PANRE